MSLGVNGVANATEVAVMFVADVEVAFADVSVPTPVEVLTTVPVIVPLVEVRLPVPDDDWGRIVDVPPGIEEVGVIDTSVVGDAVVGLAVVVGVTETAGCELLACWASRRGPGAPDTKAARTSTHARDNVDAELFMTAYEGIRL